jgi:hypothetical protein
VRDADELGRTPYEQRVVRSLPLNGSGEIQRVGFLLPSIPFDKRLVLKRVNANFDLGIQGLRSATSSLT